MSPGRGAAKLGRVALFSVTAVVLACSAHRAGGGSVSPLVALLAVPLVMLVMKPLAGHRLRPVTLLATMGLLQAGLHYSFMTLTAAAGCRITPMGSRGHLERAAAHAATMDCAPAMGHGDADSVLLGAVSMPISMMTLMHAVATALLVLVLARSDAAVWALAAAMGFRAMAILWTPLPAPDVQLTQPVSQPRIKLPQFLVVSLVSRRGPPMPAFAR